MTTFYNKAREFAKKYIDPIAKEIDEKERFPEEVFEELGKAGYFKLMIPEEFGGLGKNMQEHADACRAFAKSSATVGLCYMMHNVALNCILSYADESLKAKICKDVVENEKFLALAYSELGTGTHFYISDLKTDFKENTVVFNGVKSMVTSALQASYYLVLAPSDVEGEIDNWIIPLNTDGLNFKPNTWHGLGMRGNVSCQMVIDDVELDKSWRIGKAGSGVEQVFTIVATYFITGLAAVYTGLCQAILDEAVEHTTNRKYPDGKSLSNIETVQIHLAKIYSQTNVAVLGTNEAVRSFLAGEEDALAKILSARIFASEASIELARIGMRVGGGKAYNRMGNMERYLRDSFASHIMAPSVDVLTLWLGKAITGQQLP
ncbi:MULTISPECIES: acyl-CoA dehydrogenase family protein [Gemella]|uniref:acyl-CoA dehydrogenase family protein n=1 Tax=Gemella TaxID=1378 RepID=UPI000767E3BC|nr:MULTISPECIES: acyl-CoA dehydrogenase family protein [Gemella]AME09735.1 acyl-CoA dehydrogenase [Gemella sp. oral taxon 928]AXI27336.1 acyl-CoA dehydrogenase [Gemella sp. ND 6198]